MSDATFLLKKIENKKNGFAKNGFDYRSNFYETLICLDFHRNEPFRIRLVLDFDSIFQQENQNQRKYFFGKVLSFYLKKFVKLTALGNLFRLLPQLVGRVRGISCSWSFISKYIKESKKNCKDFD
ncbi:hypothetical protein BpHYR1_019881 [Brachionus plicatilis]|uniref:Uncharacterized protein n=1 Tax=Brachionus plicatilis TaxID=10195 RepID=A0A3M7T8W6_BRAPC|nr:hypothetical protein BpHYR1_019881 [Brachionus plicatilis]